MFSALFIKVLPLYFIIAAGYGAGRWLNVSNKQIADFTIYFINPVVLFCMIWQIDLSLPGSLLIPCIAFILMLLVSGLSYGLGKLVLKSPDENILSGQMLTGNNAYFGIPIVFLLFDNTIANYWVLIIFISSALHTSLGYYIFAAGRYSALAGFKRLLRFPPFYTLVIGLIINLLGIPWQPVLDSSFEMFKGAFSVMGMSIIGLSLATMRIKNIDFKYLLTASLCRFILWPICALIFIKIDQSVFQLLNKELYKMILLFSIMPIAAGSAAFCTQLNMHPEKAASAILVTTLLALLCIPFTISIF